VQIKSQSQLQDGTCTRKIEKKNPCYRFVIWFYDFTRHSGSTCADNGDLRMRAKNESLKWLACYTREEIADREGIPQQTIADILPKTTNLPESVKPIAFHQIDFDPPEPAKPPKASRTTQPANMKSATDFTLTPSNAAVPI
jgi:hypothetical protein